MAGRRKINAVELRQNEVLNMMKSAMTRSQIEQAWCLKYPDLSVHQLQKDITEAYKMLPSYVNTEAKNLIVENLIKYDDLYEKAIDLGQVGEARKCLNDKEKLLGLHNKTFINQFNIQNNTLIPMNHLTEEQLLKIINESEQGTDTTIS